jgi:hypothetical protein
MIWEGGLGLLDIGIIGGVTSVNKRVGAIAGLVSIIHLLRWVLLKNVGWPITF